MTTVTDEHRAAAREWIREHIGASMMYHGATLATLIATREAGVREKCAVLLEGCRLTGEGSPGPLFTAGANQMVVWGAARIREVT